MICFRLLCNSVPYLCITFQSSSGYTGTWVKETEVTFSMCSLYYDYLDVTSWLSAKASKNHQIKCSKC